MSYKAQGKVLCNNFYMSMQNGQNVEKWSSQNFDFDFQLRETAAFVFQ